MSSLIRKDEAAQGLMIISPERHDLETLAHTGWQSQGFRLRQGLGMRSTLVFHHPVHQPFQTACQQEHPLIRVTQQVKTGICSRLRYGGEIHRGSDILQPRVEKGIGMDPMPVMAHQGSLIALRVIVLPPGISIIDQQHDPLFQHFGIAAKQGDQPWIDLGGVAIGPDIIKTADIAVVVDEGKFQSAFNAVSVIAGKYGGFVQSSSTTGRESRTGSLLIRVPAQSFDEALSDLATQLGDVTRRSESGQDVSATFIDLEARLRTWEAQEAVLLRLMNEAKSIEETLRVQQQLQDVQFRIEEIKGQLQMLRDQVELATISLFLRERGAPVVTGPVADRPDLAEAWDLALNGVLGVVFAVVVGLGYVLPLTVAGVVGWFVYRRLRPRHLPAVS